MSENKQCMAVQICPVGISYDPNNQFGIVKIAPASADGIPEPTCNIIQICNTQSSNAIFRLLPNEMNNQNTPSQNPINTTYDNQVPDNMYNQNNNQVPDNMYNQNNNQVPNNMYNQNDYNMNIQSTLYGNQNQPGTTN
jgi:hypothetical protein